MLGADVPSSAVADAVARRAAPARVLLWSQQSSTAAVAAVRAAANAGAEVFGAGPGWVAAGLSGEVRVLTDLAAAVDVLS